MYIFWFVEIVFVRVRIDIFDMLSKIVPRLKKIILRYIYLKCNDLTMTFISNEIHLIDRAKQLFFERNSVNN